MKIVMKIFVVGFLVALCAQSAFAGEYDFRKTKWGMSLEKVKSSESLTPFAKDKKTLMYKTKILNKKVILVYSFIENRLVSGSYLIKESHTNKNDYIDDYKSFKKTLTKKYGKPKIDRVIWKNNLYKDDYSNWGMAVSMGHLVYVSKWETQNTKISIGLTGDNFEMNHGIVYASKNLTDFQEKTEEKEALNVL